MQMPHWPQVPLWNSNKKMGLEVSLKLLAALDNSHKKLPPTIHIAGTNGKGSSLAMLKSIYSHAGYKVHSYSSPHLLHFNERINLAGMPISDGHLYELLKRVRVKSEEMKLEPTFFEGTTIAAFLAFAQNPADILIMETGLGGRLDCTNVIPNPMLTIITSISYDHMEYLGDDLLQIAAEKAGIIKENTPCIISSQTDEVSRFLMEQCNQKSAPSFCYGYDYGIEKLANSFKYLSQKYDLELPHPSLPGDHQLINAASVVAAIMLTNNKFKITGSQIATGLKNIDWPGRIEKIDPKKYSHLASDNINIYLDGAHNDAGAKALSVWIKDNLKEPTYLIIGMTKNRDVSSFCNHFKEIINEGRAVSVLSEPSSYSGDFLQEKAAESGIKFIASDSLEEAIKDITNINDGTKANIIITGSLFLVSDFYKLL